MELQEEITAYVDNQLHDQLITLRMRELIDLDAVIRDEFLIQKKVKILLSTRFACGCSSKRLQKKILSNISRM
ncbi:MAG: hypothetical protein CVV24_03180 [Ignavibacteriae bacterium HGW-Ignavibacteriae-3]|nr:MAG: hypothetical protein CVV24_03180 [Ignavibacteriae bacterium HGW-Ignavibacteriae-3]